MYCAQCGRRNDEDAAFCERCGADLRSMPRPQGTPPAVPPPEMPPPPMYRPPARPRAWWYPIGVWVILSAFFLFIDLLSAGVDFAYFVIGILGIFMVGFPLLRRLEEWSAQRRGGPPR